MTARFELGQITTMPGPLEVFSNAGVDPLQLLSRHAHGDWGDVDPEDAAENDYSVLHGFRIMSSFMLPAGRVWIITEANRSLTTLVLPSEY